MDLARVGWRLIEEANRVGAFNIEHPLAGHMETLRVTLRTWSEVCCPACGTPETQAPSELSDWLEAQAMRMDAPDLARDYLLELARLARIERRTVLEKAARVWPGACG